MKRLTAWLFALALLFSLAAPAQAALEYKLLYDATEVFDREMCWAIGAERLTELSDTCKTQVRIDIVTNTEGFSVDDYAGMFYLNYDYGYGTTKDCILLMLHMEADDTGVSLVDYTAYCDGQNKAQLEGFLTLVEPYLGGYLKKASWTGSVDSDNRTLQALADAYIACAGGFLRGELEPIIPEPIIKQGDRIWDDSDLLSDEDWVALEAAALEVSGKHDTGIYVAIVENFADDGSATALEAAENRYKAKGLGLGPNREGALLLISMDEGHYAIYANTPSIQEQQVGELSDILLDRFAAGLPAKGLKDYIAHCDKLLSGGTAPAPEIPAEAEQPQNTGVNPYILGIMAVCAVLILLILRELLPGKKEK